MRCAVLLLCLFAVACHRKKSPDPHRESAQRADPEADVLGDAPQGEDSRLPKSIEGSPMVRGREIDLAIFSAARPTAAFVANAQATARKRFPDMDVRIAPPAAKPPSALVFAPPIAQYMPPTEHDLAFFGRGLDDAAMTAAPASKGVLILFWTLADDPTRAQLRSLQSFAADLANTEKGFVWDETTRELYSPETWKTKRIDGWQDDVPIMSQHIAIHYYATDGGGHRAVTLGMVKFGLPDLVVDDLPLAQSDAMRRVIHATAQMLVEGAELAHGGVLHLNFKSIRHDAAREMLLHGNGKTAKARGRLVLAPVHGEEGDPGNRLMAIQFPTYPGASKSEKQASALLAIVGGERDEMSRARGNDPELNAATARAQARLPAVADAFRKGLPLGQRIAVKAPFDTDSGGTEWMWIEVTQWTAGVVYGSLQNTPNDIESLRLGAKVETNQSTIADYVWRNADGSLREGGESITIFQERQEGKK